MAALDYTSSIVLGIIEGLTEFIPVSSTGHLILVRAWIGIEGEKSEAFEIFIQLGAILAVLWLYWPRFAALFDFKEGFEFSSCKKAGWGGFRAILLLAVACTPVFIVGAALGSRLHSWLGFPVSIAAALIVGGVAMCLLDREGRSAEITRLEDITFKAALLIGIFQCLALWPGISRSGSSIIGGLIFGLDRIAAAQFSFIVAVPVMTAAALYKLAGVWDTLTLHDFSVFMLGFAVAFVTAVLAIQVFMRLLARISLRPFGYYRVLLGLAVLAVSL